MDIIALDERERLFLSPAIDDWQPIHERGISVVIDLEGGLDHGVPTVPGEMLYVYLPIFDEDLPDLSKVKSVAKLGAELIDQGQKVLTHCTMGLNRSALVAGLILVHLGMHGRDAVALLRAKRPGALFNETFAEYLNTIAEF